jgi:oxygen-dependent protoporphyrinogen oxidase
MHSPKGEETVAGFIYYPDHLVGIPSLSKELMKDPTRALRAIQRLVAMPLEPVFRDLVPSIINVLRNQKDPQSLDILEGRRDMSIGDYYAHRFGRPGMVDKVMSAMIHGITGGDVWKQSMASGFLADTLAPTGNIPITKTRARLADMAMMRVLFRDKSTFDLAAKHVESNAIWFRNGFNTLTNALARSLQANPNVTINQNDPATWLHYSESTDNVLVSTLCCHALPPFLLPDPNPSLPTP